MKKLHQLLTYFESQIPNAERTNPLVSTSTVGWQIDHSLRVLLSIVTALEHSDPKRYQNKFSLMKYVVLFTGHIPRGKVQAPKQVQTLEPITATDLHRQLDQASAALIKLEHMAPGVTFKHPLFGPLNKAQTIRFLEIHTRHHQKIIRDILK